MVNLTLVVQMVHFWIAYFFLRTFFWRPLLATIQQEAQWEEKQHKKIATQEEKAAFIALERAASWQQARKDFAATLVLPVEFDKVAYKVPVMEPFSVDRTLLQPDKELVQKLTKLVCHVGD